MFSGLLVWLQTPIVSRELVATKLMGMIQTKLDKVHLTLCTKLCLCNSTHILGFKTDRNQAFNYAQYRKICPNGGPVNTNSTFFAISYTVTQIYKIPLLY